MSEILNPPQPSQAAVMNTGTNTGLSTLGSIFTSAVSTSRSYGAEVTNIRGLADAKLPFSSVISGASLNRDDLLKTGDCLTKKLEFIYNAAHDVSLGSGRDSRSAQARDRGADIKALLPLLKDNPELIEKLYNLATATTLFDTEKNVGFTPDDKAEAKEDFERRRREYLVDVIRFAAHPEQMVQGPGAMCTATSMLKKLDSAQFLKLATEYGTNGKVTTRSGKEMVALDEYHARSLSNSDTNISQLRSLRPSAGMLSLLDGVQALGVPRNAIQTGSYWHQYTEAWEHLSGKKAACAAGDATIHFDKLGNVVKNQVDSAKSVGTFSYVLDQLSTGKSVLVDTKWSHAGAYTGADGQHGRHMLKATGTVTKNGAQYVVLDNPIGAFVDGKKGAFYAPGTVLGEKSGFWFETGEAGTVYVRADVLKEHLQTVVVEQDEEFAFDKFKAQPPLGIGELDREEIQFVRVGEEPEEELVTKKSESAEEKSKYVVRDDAAIEQYVAKQVVEKPVSGRVPEGKVRVFRNGHWVENDHMIVGGDEFARFVEEKRAKPDLRADEVKGIERLAKKDEEKSVVRGSHFTDGGMDGVEGSKLAGRATVWGFGGKNHKVI